MWCSIARSLLTRHLLQCVDGDVCLLFLPPFISFPPFLLFSFPLMTENKTGIRLMDELNVPTVEEPPQFWVVEAHAKANATSASVSSTSLWLAQRLRAVGHTVRHDHGTVLKKQLKAASQHGADVVFIVGEDEVAGGTVSVKNMATGEQVAMPLDTDWAQFL